MPWLGLGVWYFGYGWHVLPRLVAWTWCGNGFSTLRPAAGDDLRYAEDVSRDPGRKDPRGDLTGSDHVGPGDRPDVSRRVFLQQKNKVTERATRCHTG